MIVSTLTSHQGIVILCFYSILLISIFIWNSSCQTHSCSYHIHQGSWVISRRCQGSSFLTPGDGSVLHLQLEYPLSWMATSIFILVTSVLESFSHSHNGLLPFLWKPLYAIYITFVGCKPPFLFWTLESQY